MLSMSQQPRGSCLSEFNARPDVLSVPFIGQVEKLAHSAHNMWSDEPQPRRADGIRQKYGSGTPTLNGAKTNTKGPQSAQQALKEQQGLKEQQAVHSTIPEVFGLPPQVPAAAVIAPAASSPYSRGPPVHLGSRVTVV